LIDVARPVARQHLDQALTRRDELILLSSEQYRRRFRVDGLRLEREGVLLTLERVDLRGRRVEFALLVPDRGQREPADEHHDRRHDGEGHHPVVAITSYEAI